MTRTRFAATSAASALATLLLLAGCGSGIYPYSLDPKPPVPAPFITLSPTALAFATQITQTSVAQTVTVGNTGNATLNIAAVTLADTTDYTITSNTCGATLAATATCAISLSFTPKSVGTLNSTLNFTDNSGNVANATQSVTLAGISTATPEPLAVLAPSSIAFPNTPTGTAATAQLITVSNNGTAALLTTSAAISGNADFTIASTTCTGSLAPAASCTYTIGFSPTTATAETATFTLTDNSNGIVGSTQTVALSGTGTAPAPIITISPTSLAFGNQTLGTTSAAQTVTIGNIGNAVLNIASITLSDLDDYTETSTCGPTLGAGSTCTLTITFNPQNLGSLPATITLVDNTGNVTGATQSISLTGTSIAPAAPSAILTPTTYTFPSTAAGSTSASETFTLSNPGTAALTISGINVVGTSAGFNESATCLVGSTLPPGTSCTFTITFAPSASGTYSGSITVTDNAGGVAGSTQTSTFSGTATPSTSSSLVLTPSTPVQFPDTLVGSTSAPQMFTLSNTGGAAATSLSVTITGGATKIAFAISSTNCSATLAGGASCSISVTFTPASPGGTYIAYLTASDSVANSAVSTELDANGTSPCTSNLFSPTSLAFPTTKVNTTSNKLTSTLTNCGTAPLTISSITLGGTNASNFTETNNCPPTIAGGASCTITANFSPTAVTSYSATVTVVSNSPNAQSLPLSGTGTNSSITYQLYQFPDPDFTTGLATGALNALYALIDSAQSTIDMTMYEMQDAADKHGTSHVITELVSRCKVGVKVRVLFSKSVASSSSSAYNTLNTTTNCSAEYSNSAFTNTHQKTLTADNATTAVMSLNLQGQYYDTTRDFMMIYNDPNDISAIEATFAQDWAAGTPYGGTQGPSDFSYQPSTGTDLIWSPTTAQAAMTNIIANAQHDLLIENEELASSASYIINAMVAACQRGVTLHLAMVDQSSYESNFKTLEAAGCGVHVYPDSSSGFYIHAKAVVADYGLPTQSVYMGSINYSNASMNQNRELGLYITDPTSITQLFTTMTADYNGGTTY